MEQQLELSFSNLTPASQLAPWLLRIAIDPGFGKVGDKLFRILAALEAIDQAADAVRATLAIVPPCNLGARGPLFIALVQRREGDDQSIFVIKICHAAGIIDNSPSGFQPSAVRKTSRSNSDGAP